MRRSTRAGAKRSIADPSPPPSKDPAERPAVTDPPHTAPWAYSEGALPAWAPHSQKLPSAEPSLCAHPPPCVVSKDRAGRGKGQTLRSQHRWVWKGEDQGRLSTTSCEGEGKAPARESCPALPPVTCPPRGLLAAPGGGRPGPGPLLGHLLGDRHDPSLSGGGRAGCLSVLGLSGADAAASRAGARATAAQRGAPAVGRAPHLQPRPSPRPPPPGPAARAPSGPSATRAPAPPPARRAAPASAA